MGPSSFHCYSITQQKPATSFYFVTFSEFLHCSIFDFLKVISFHLVTYGRPSYHHQIFTVPVLSLMPRCWFTSSSTLIVASDSQRRVCHCARIQWIFDELITNDSLKDANFVPMSLMHTIFTQNLRFSCPMLRSEWPQCLGMPWKCHIGSCGCR